MTILVISLKRTEDIFIDPNFRKKKQYQIRNNDSLEKTTDNEVDRKDDMFHVGNFNLRRNWACNQRNRALSSPHVACGNEIRNNLANIKFETPLKCQDSIFSGILTLQA